jgi:hypothetical protein
MKNLDHASEAREFKRRQQAEEKRRKLEKQRQEKIDEKKRKEEEELRKERLAKDLEEGFKFIIMNKKLSTEKLHI